MAVLDDLATELRGSVRRAVATREQTDLVAEFDRMRSDVEDATVPLRESLAVLGAPELSVQAETAEKLSSQRELVRGLLEKVRETVTSDPTKVRQGTLWRN